MLNTSGWQTLRNILGLLTPDGTNIGSHAKGVGTLMFVVSRGSLSQNFGRLTYLSPVFLRLSRLRVVTDIRKCVFFKSDYLQNILY